MLGVPNSVANRHQRQLLLDQRVLQRVRAGRLAREQPPDRQRSGVRVRVRRRIRRALQPRTWRGLRPSARSCRSARPPRHAYLRNPIPGLPSIDVRRRQHLRWARTARRDALNNGPDRRGCPRRARSASSTRRPSPAAATACSTTRTTCLNDGINQFGYSRGTGRSSPTTSGSPSTERTSPPPMPRQPRRVPDDPCTIRSRSAPTARASTSRSATRSASWRGRAAAIDYVDRRLEARASAPLARRRPARARTHGWSPKSPTSAIPNERHRPDATGSTSCRRSSGPTATCATTAIADVPRWHGARIRSTSASSSSCGRPIRSSTTTWPRTASSRRRPSAAISSCARYPHMNGLQNTRVPSGKSSYHHVEMSLQQRLIGGFEFTVAYTRAWDETRRLLRQRVRRAADVASEQLVESASLHDHRDRGAALRRRQAMAVGARHPACAARRMAGVRHLSPAERPRDRLGQSLLLRRQLRGHRAPRSDRDRARWFNTDDFERAARGSRRRSTRACSRADSTSCAATT